MTPSSFYSAATKRLRVIDRLPVGGELVDLRHLTVAEAFELWDRLRSIIPSWTSFFLSPELPVEKRDLSWVDPLYQHAFAVLFRDRGMGWVNERLARGTPGELRAVYDFFVQAHDWKKILQGLFDVVFEEDEEARAEVHPQSSRSALEIFVELEIETGRKVEDLLGMRCEAFLDYLEARKAVAAVRQRALRAARSGGQVVSPSDLGLGLPGFIFSKGPGEGDVGPGNASGEGGGEVS